MWFNATSFDHCIGVETGTYIPEDSRTLWHALRTGWAGKTHWRLRLSLALAACCLLSIYFVLDLHNKSFYKDKVHILEAPTIICTSVFLRDVKKLENGKRET